MDAAPLQSAMGLVILSYYADPNVVGRCSRWPTAPIPHSTGTGIPEHP
jgi:hypothetical protein